MQALVTANTAGLVARYGLRANLRRFPQLVASFFIPVLLAGCVTMQGLDFTRFRRQISASSSKLLECLRAQLV
jgi:hypothetical protein